MTVGRRKCMQCGRTVTGRDVIAHANAAAHIRPCPLTGLSQCNDKQCRVPKCQQFHSDSALGSPVFLFISIAAIGLLGLYYFLFVPYAF